MILLCTGTQHFPFDRLLETVDRLIAEGRLEEQVLAQTGYCRYVPRHFSGQAFFEREELLSLMDEAEIILTHGGSGTIMQALLRRKKVIAVPRLARYGEHVDDHQLQIVRSLEEQGYIASCADLSDLENVIARIKERQFRIYTGDPQGIAEDIRDYLGSL